MVISSEGWPKNRCDSERKNLKFRPNPVQFRILTYPGVLLGDIRTFCRKSKQSWFDYNHKVVWISKNNPDRQMTISQSRTLFSLFGPQNSFLDRFCHTRAWFVSQRPDQTIFNHPNIEFRDKNQPQSKILESKTSRVSTCSKVAQGLCGRKYV